MLDIGGGAVVRVTGTLFPKGYCSTSEVLPTE